MALTPEQIEGQEFVSTLRGYDRREVSAFLRVVAEDHRRLLEERAVVAAPPAPVDVDQQVALDVAGILRAGREAAQRARTEGEREAHDTVRQAMAKAEEIAIDAERLLADARARAAASDAEAEARAAEVLARANAGAQALLEQAEAQFLASNEEAADLLEQARASAWETMQEARAFRDEVHEEAAATLARARADADAVLARADAQRRQLLATQADARAKLAGTDAVVRALLRRLDEAGMPFADEEPEPVALSVVGEPSPAATGA